MVALSQVALSQKSLISIDLPSSHLSKTLHCLKHRLSLLYFPPSFPAFHFACIVSSQGSCSRHYVMTTGKSEHALENHRFFNFSSQKHPINKPLRLMSCIYILFNLLSWLLTNPPPSYRVIVSTTGVRFKANALENALEIDLTTYTGSIQTKHIRHFI